MRKKTVRIFVVLLFIVILFGCSLEKIINGRKHLETLPLTIITVNDLHGYIEQNEDGMNGLSNMSYLINEIRNENDLNDVILIGNGDLFQGTFISNATYGRAVIDSMNQMGFDAMGIGNHEFDWGIETILQYFDGIEENGEADFPLLNANIYLNNDDSLLTVDNGNVFESYVVEREGVEVGIISYIGDVYGSISYDKVEDYYFDLNIANSVEKIAGNLKDSGVDFVIVNIHGGAYNFIDYEYNLELAELTDDEGNYLVDVVINGHTHSCTGGIISRDGIGMVAIQAGSNGEYFGKITLNIKLDKMEITDIELDIVNVSDAGTNYDEDVENIIDYYLENTEDEILAVAGETIYNRSDLYNWVGNVMVAATGADIAIHNTGGVRSTGGITKGENVTLSQLYEISPFDNNIYLIETTYQELQPLLSSGVFYSIKEGVNLNYSDTCTVAIISYVYYWYQLDDIRSDNDIDTELFIRDILVEDIRIKGDLGESFSPISNSRASISKLYE